MAFGDQIDRHGSYSSEHLIGILWTELGHWQRAVAVFKQHVQETTYYS